MKTNSDRARRAERAVIAYDGDEANWKGERSRDFDQDDAHQVIKDMLGDLRHLCDRVGVDFDAADSAASKYYEAERSADPAGDWPLFLIAGA